MPTRIAFGLAGAALFTLAGCAPGTTDADISTLRTADRQGNGVRAEMVRRCVVQEGGRTGAGRTYLANLMGVPEASVPQVFCERMTQGTLDGRLTAADLNSPVTGRYSPALIRELQRG